MRTSRILGGMLVCCSVVALMGPELAQAQSSREDTINIIVTAQRRAESLQKVPMTVNVATGEQIEKLNIFDFKDVARLAPGLELTNNDGRTNTATLRGITYSPDSGTTPAVDVYVNDIPVDPQVAFTAIYDIGQIEVLRGPQGIYRGRTSPAGAITITTRKPNLNEPEGYFTITGTSRDAVNAQGGASVPLIPGKLALRAAALVDANHVNQVRDVNLNNRRSSQKTMSGRLSLAFQPTEDFSAILTYQHLWSDTTPFIAVFGPGATPFAPFGIPTPTGPALDIGDRRAVSPVAPRFTNRTDLVTLATEVNLADNLVWSTDLGYQNSLLSQSRGDLFNASPGFPQTQRISTPYKIFTADTRLSSDGPGFLNWMVGAFYTKSDPGPVEVRQTNDLFGYLPAFPPFLPAPSIYHIPVDVAIDLPIKSSGWALFGSMRMNFTDRLRLDAGLRYNHSKVTQQAYLSSCAPVCSAPAALLGPDAANRKKGVFTGGASLSYDWSQDLTTYVSYGRAFRPRTVTVGAAYADLPQELLISKDETSDSVEVGLKASMLDRKVSLNVSAFYQKYKNYIDHVDVVNVRTTAADGTPIIAAIPTNSNGDAISKGIEAQLTGRLTPNLDVGANLSYVDAHYDNANLPCDQFDASGNPFIPAGQDFATCLRNDRIAQVPKFTASVNGEYRFPMGSVTPFVRTLVNFRPGFTSERDNFKYRSFTNVNLYLGVRGENDRWEITAFAKNLLDQARPINLVYNGREGQTSLFDIGFGTGPGTLSAGYRGVVVSPPREFGITGRFTW